MKQTLIFKLFGFFSAGFRQTSVYQSFAYLIEGKSNFLMSISIGGAFASVFNFIKLNTPQEILGCSITLWTLAFAINIWDISTGIKADSFVQKENGLKPVFKPEKGWKAFEKIIGFTAVIWFLYEFEKEAVRLEYAEVWSDTFNYAKFIFFFYVILIELKSVGNNNEVRFGKKDEMFNLLDSIILIVNDGIMSRLKSIFKSKTETNE